MRARRVASACALLLVLGAGTSAAAVSRLALETGYGGAAPSPVLRGAWLAPALGIEGRQASLSLDGRLGTSSFLRDDRAARLRLAAMLREGGRLRPELLLLGAGREGEAGVREEMRLHLSGGRAGTWIGAAAEAAAAGGRPGLHVGLLGFGAWARSHRFTLEGAVEQHMGLLRARREAAPPDSGRSMGDRPAGGLGFDPEEVVLSSAYAGARWEGERLEVESVGGVTVGPLAAPRRWAQASLAWRLSSQLALVASAGSRSPQYFAIDPAGERHAAVSIRFSQQSSGGPRITIASRAQAEECRLHPVEGGLWRVEVRAPGARLVELQGDATGWQPQALRAEGGGRWAIELALSPGIHQLSLRVDGGPWLPPPGFPSEPDGFGGSVGVAVIESR